MTQPTSNRFRSHHDEGWLDQRIDTWVEAGLISHDEALAVQDYEHAAAASTHDEPPPAVLGLFAEVGAYVGILLALAGAIVALQPNWRDVPLVAQLGLAACVAIVGFACGTWLVQIDEAATRRLGGVLWVLGSAGAALGSALVIDALEPARDAWTALAAGFALLTTGLVLWRNLERPLQLATWMAGAAAALGASGVLLGLDPWQIGIIGWMLAAGWLVLTFELTVRPLVVARCLGSVVMLLCSFMLADLDQRLGSIAAAATGAIVIALALWTGMIPVLIVGGVGMLIAAQSLMQTTLRGVGAGAALVLGGLVMVAMIVLRLHSRSRTA
jgi:hypothetical protein